MMEDVVPDEARLLHVYIYIPYASLLACKDTYTINDRTL